ncbi:MAG: hypothetical protein U0136_08285 [Bdellovibrionota bacterium]
MARCIDPTDGNCSSVSVEAPRGERNWYRLSPETSVTSQWTDRYSYKAAVTEQKWEAVFDAFEIHRVMAPQISYTTHRVTQKLYTPELNKFERRFLSIDSDLTTTGYFTPLFDPNFPDMDPVYERSVRDLGLENWSWIRLDGQTAGRTRPIALPTARTTTLPTQAVRFRRGEDLDTFKVIEFVTPYFEVPRLSSPGEDLQCGSAHACGAFTAAGAEPVDFRTAAFIAVKTFSTVVALRPDQSPKIRWANDGHGVSTLNNGTWGLQIETLSAQTYSDWSDRERKSQTDGTLPAVEPTPLVQCLGGRDGSSASDVVHGTGQNRSFSRNYDLRLRGPLERDTKTGLPLADGRDPACPNGDIQHWGLRVERGGAYRFRAFMMVKGGDVDIAVTFKHYFDNYATIPSELRHCHREIAAPADWSEARGQPCPACSAEHGEELNLNCRLIEEPLLIDSEADAQDAFTVQMPQVPQCSKAIRGAYCDGAHPSLSSECALYLSQHPERAFRTWKEEQVRELEISDLPAQCSLPLATRSIPCGDGRTEVSYRSDGNYGIPSRCPAAVNIANMSRQEATALNAEQPADAPIFPVTAPKTFSWDTPLELTPPRWVVSFRAVDDDGRELTGTDTIRHTTQRRRNDNPILKHTDATWSPPAEAFGLSSGTRISTQIISEQRRFASAVYPFASDPEFEIPSFLPIRNNLENCVGEPATLEARLRAYATSEFPQLSDSSIELEASADYRDTVQTLLESDCAQLSTFRIDVPACTNRYTAKQSLKCGEDRFLGRFPVESFPSGPSECFTGAACRSEAASETTPDSERLPIVDLAAAKKIGLKQIEQVLPGSMADCDAAGCVSIDINLGQQGKTIIDLTYRMPLTFPFSAIIGRADIPIHNRKVEVRELAGLGRFGAPAFEELP